MEFLGASSPDDRTSTIGEVPDSSGEGDGEGKGEGEGEGEGEGKNGRSHGIAGTGGSAACLARYKAYRLLSSAIWYLSGVQNDRC